jgi:tetratricopeptide (TPR) repeat protein
MKKEFLIIIIASVALAAFLMVRPKVVVNNKTGKLDAGTAKTSTNNKASTDSQPHSQALSPAVQKRIDELKSKLAPASGSQRSDIIKLLMVEFSSANRLDSAAKYAEGLLAIDNSEANLLIVADTYYQAYGFAITNEKGNQLAVKSREFYQKALDKNPNLLKAKTNMAMTYVTSETPMAGIMLLREVLNDEPTYVPALMNMGLLSMQSNQFDKASERFRAILKNNPENFEAEFYLGICLAELGEKTEAKKYLESVLKKNTDPAIKQSAKETLESLK